MTPGTSQRSGTPTTCGTCSSLFPEAEEDQAVRERLLEEVNDLRLVVAHRFLGGMPVEFLYNRQLLERELAKFEVGDVRPA
ncbi:hypothetical protein ACFL6C_01260 [Myxococcota bacterium]